MGSLVNVPAGRDDSATPHSVAALINELAFPTILPLATDTAVQAAWSHLPALPDPATAKTRTEPVRSSQAPDTVSPAGAAAVGAAAAGGSQVGSRMELAQALWDDCAASLAAVYRHQNQCAAVMAGIIERYVSAGLLEVQALGTSKYLREGQLRQLQSEVAVILGIPEGKAAALIEQSTTLIRYLPATMALLGEGSLGWEHSVQISEETTLLREAGIGQDIIDTFEHALLGLADGATMPSFREKARRLRERSYPETIPARTRRAFAQRNISISRVYDGMSFFTLYAPAVTIEAIWDQCTATAQAVQGPHEDRTLTQLRADVAAALLLGQTMDENRLHTPPPEPANTFQHAGAEKPAMVCAGGEDADRFEPWPVPAEPDPCGDDGCVDTFHGEFTLAPELIPEFTDPD